jgi:transposase
MRPLVMRNPTHQEWTAIERRASSRTAPANQVQRARLLKHMAQGLTAPKAAARAGASGQTARTLLKRFNEQGLEVLEDKPRPGRPRALTEQDRGRLMLLARSQPQGVLQDDQADCHWTLDTLLEAARQAGITISRSHLARALNQEGVRWWRRSRSWLSSADPELPEKRGRLSASTPPRRRGAP